MTYTQSIKESGSKLYSFSLESSQVLADLLFPTKVESSYKRTSGDKNIAKFLEKSN